MPRCRGVAHHMLRPRRSAGDVIAPPGRCRGARSQAHSARPALLVQDQQLDSACLGCWNLNLHRGEASDSTRQKLIRLRTSQPRAAANVVIITHLCCSTFLLACLLFSTEVVLRVALAGRNYYAAMASTTGRLVVVVIIAVRKHIFIMLLEISESFVKG